MPDTAAIPTVPTLAIKRLVVLRSRPAAVRRPRRARRARAAVFAGIALYLLMQAALNAAVVAEWLPLRDPVYAEKADLLATRPEFYGPRPAGTPPRLLAIGSSRTQLGFDAAAVERATDQPIRAFNFGVPAAGAMTSALYLRRLLDAGVSPEFVTVEIHPGFTSDLSPPYESRWLHLYRLRPNEVDRLRSFGWAVESPPQHGWRGWAAASFAYRYAILNRYFPKMMPCPYGLFVGAKMDANGFVTGHDVPAHQKADALRRARDEYAPTFVDYRPGGPGVEAVRDMLGVCRDRGIRAAVVLMPEASAYRGWYGADGYRRIGEWVESLKRKYGVEVADARVWVPDAHFADGHHLTAEGAKIYSTRLATDFIGPWVEGASR